ncbi:MAG: alkaline phosphatase, partial [Pseudomonadota bacterium]
MDAGRRYFLDRIARLASLAACTSAYPGAALARTSSYPFTLGVASGSPRPDSVVLWTRLLPDP